MYQKSVHPQRFNFILPDTFKYKTGKKQNNTSLDNYWACLRDMSKDRSFVHTSWRRIRDFSWNLLKIAVTLHQKISKTKV